MSSIVIANILDRLKRDDNDFRYMALSDLQNEMLKETFELAYNKRRPLTDALLKSVVDNNSECRGMAVQCISLFTRKVDSDMVERLVTVLFNRILDNEEEFIDISSLALKRIIQSTPEESIATLLPVISPFLFNGLSGDRPIYVVQEVLDILLELLQHFGMNISDRSWQDKALSLTLNQLRTLKLTIRKRASNCLGHLSLILSDSLMRILMKEVMQNASTSSKTTAFTYMYAISVICRFSGNKMSPYIPGLYAQINENLLIDNSKANSEDRGSPTIGSVDDTEMDDLREISLKVLETLVLLCSDDMSKYFEEIITICLEFVSYDPNFAEEYMNMDEDDEEWMLDNEEDEDYSDDEDNSWKVRRGAAKLIAAVFSARLEMLAVLLPLFPKISPIILNRICKEHEENVRLDLLATYTTILSQLRMALSSVGGHSVDYSTMLTESVGDIVAMCKQSLVAKSGNVRINTLLLIAEAVQCKRNLLEGHMEMIDWIMKAIVYKTRSETLAIEVYALLRLIIENHDPSLFKPYMVAVTDHVMGNCLESSYRMASESLQLLRTIISIIRVGEEDESAEMKGYLIKIADTLILRLDKKMLATLDREIKEGALWAIAGLLSQCGDLIEDRVVKCLDIIYERVENEISRVYAIKALVEVLNSPLHVDISSIFSGLIPQLCSYLKKTSRVLLRNTLDALLACVVNYPNLTREEHLVEIMTEVTQLISEKDMHITHITLNLILVSIRSRHCGEAVKMIFHETVLKAIYRFVGVAVVQSQLMDVMESLFAEIGTQETVDELIGLVTAETKKESIETISHCISVISLKNEDILHGIVRDFIQELKTIQNDVNAPVNMHNVLLALYTISAIGSRFDLTAFSNLQEIMIASFRSSNEDVRAGSATALGHMAVGNMEVYLGFILEELRIDVDNQYLTLHALYELIGSVHGREGAVDQLRERDGVIVDSLLQACRRARTEEEGTRNVVAECLSKLSAISPKLVMEQLHIFRNDESVSVRAAIIEATKYMLTDKEQPVDVYMEKDLVEFLSALSDEDIIVRRCAIQTLNYAIINKFRFVREHLPNLLPPLLRATKVDKSLIRVVNLGPLHHKVDDGLDMRKSAYNCVFTLLKTDLTSVNVNEMLDVCVTGFKDPSHDIKLRSHTMAIHITKVAPQSVIGSLSKFIPPIAETLAYKVKEFAIKQEVESNEEVVQSTFRMIYAMEKMPNMQTHNAEFANFMTRILKNGEIKNKYESVKKKIVEEDV